MANYYIAPFSKKSDFASLVRFLLLVFLSIFACFVIRDIFPSVPIQIKHEVKIPDGWNKTFGVVGMSGMSSGKIQLTCEEVQKNKEGDVYISTLKGWGGEPFIDISNVSVKSFCLDTIRLSSFEKEFSDSDSSKKMEIKENIITYTAIRHYSWHTNNVMMISWFLLSFLVLTILSATSSICLNHLQEENKKKIPAPLDWFFNLDS